MRFTKEDAFKAAFAAMVFTTQSAAALPSEPYYTNAPNQGNPYVPAMVAATMAVTAAACCCYKMCQFFSNRRKEQEQTRAPENAEQTTGYHAV